MSIKKHIAKATLIILIFSILGKLLGFVREIIIAGIFGTTAFTDAYFVGLSVPDFFREIISGSVLAAVFIPVYSAFIEKNEQERSHRFLNTITTLLLFVMVFVVVLCLPFTNFLVRLFAPDLTEPAFSSAVNIARIIFPATIFMGLAGLYGSLLNVHKHFLLPSLIQLMLNAGIIGGAVLLSRRFGIYSLAIGFVAGGIFQFVILVPSLRLKEIKYYFDVEWFPELKQMFYMWGPLLLAAIASVGTDVVSRALASGLDSGNIAALNFANRIRETVWLLCGVPLGTAVFPYLSSVHAQNAFEEFKKIVDYAIGVTVFLALPLSLFMLVFSKPITSILFERGAFNSFSTVITSSALTFYSTGALFYALNFVVLRIYYSRQNAITPLKIYLAGFVVNLILGYLLRQPYQVGGIALARSVSDLFCFAVMIYYLKPSLPGFKFGIILKKIAVILSISVVSIGAAFWIFNLFPAQAGLAGKLAVMAVAAAATTMLYVLFCRLFKIKELESIIVLIKNKLVSMRARQV